MIVSRAPSDDRECGAALLHDADGPNGFPLIVMAMTTMPVGDNEVV